jgi:hypothetical protein
LNPSTEGTGAGTRPASPVLFYAAVALILVAGIWHSARLATVNDDAFISFRYAQQLVNGNGLVYNPGERVEGYTNFLWTMLIAGGMSFGADPVDLSIALGIAFFAGTLLVASLLSRRLNPAGIGAFPFIPLAALALVLHRDVNVYATSGLETSMQAFLLTSLFATLVLRDDPRGFLHAGLILTAALLTRPDAAVAVVAVAAFILLERKDVVRRFAWFALPLGLLFVPYWIVRWQYFGFFYPNAFYAKSIGLPYYGQGWTYAWLYFSAYYSVVIVPLAAAAAFFIGKRGRPSEVEASADGVAMAVGTVPGTATPETTMPDTAFPETARRALRLGILLAGLSLAFIVRIGGDFMFARFFIPVTAVLYLLLEILVRRVKPAWLGYALAMLLVVGTLFRYDHFSAASQVGYIADEWQRYPLSSLAQTRVTGATLGRYFSGLPVQVAFWGGQARLVYYAEPWQAIETMTGLTDTLIAHSRLGERGRPGHEKTAPEEYLVERGVDFSFRPFQPPPGGFPLNLVVFDSIAARIVTYRTAVMDSLRKYPGVRFQGVPEYLDRYLALIDGKSPADVADDFTFFRDFYFRHNDDPSREGAFREFFRRAGVPVPGG